MIEVSESCLPIAPGTRRGSVMESSVSHRIFFPLPVGGWPVLLAARSRFAVVVVCSISLGSIAGCSKSNQPPLANVHGRVTLDGKPVVRATVVFAPVAGGRQSRGVTNDQGEYELTYIRDDKGGAVGRNNVQISKLKSHDPRSETLPQKYNRDSTLTAEVKSGTNEIDFPLTSK